MRSGAVISVQVQWFGYALPSGPWIVASQTPPGLKSNELVTMLPPLGVHHCSRWAALLNASNTIRRGPSMIRDTTIERSASVLASVVICVLLLLQFLHVFVEPVKALVPVPLEPHDPVVDRFEAARVERVEPLLSRLADAHETDLAQHPKVLRRPGLRDA